MLTITIQIGNSDDKLSQKQWAHFVTHVDERVRTYARQIHFTGFSAGDAPWQNACWILVTEPNEAVHLRRALALLCASFDQDSIAWLEGETEFISPAPISAVSSEADHG